MCHAPPGCSYPEKETLTHRVSSAISRSLLLFPAPCDLFFGVLQAAENETRQWDSLRRKLQADVGTAEPPYPEGSRPAVMTADHLDMILARLGLIGATIVPLSASEADLSQPPVPGDAPSIGCALSRPSLRSRGGTLSTYGCPCIPLSTPALLPRSTGHCICVLCFRCSVLTLTVC